MGPCYLGTCVTPLPQRIPPKCLLANQQGTFSLWVSLSSASTLSQISPHYFGTLVTSVNHTQAFTDQPAMIVLIVGLSVFSPTMRQSIPRYLGTLVTMLPQQQPVCPWTEQSQARLQKLHPKCEYQVVHQGAHRLRHQEPGG